MKFLSKFFRRKPKFFPVFSKLSPELIKRYGSQCFPGQIDKTMKDLGISEELKDYAYVLFLREDEYKAKKSQASEKFRRLEKEIQEYLKSRPARLGKGYFYETGAGFSGAAGMGMFHR